MNRYTLAATATFGLESVVASELHDLGIRDVTVENGRVLFDGTDDDLARSNLWLRSADRVLVVLADFAAETLDEVYEGVRSITWSSFLPHNPRLDVSARESFGPRSGAGKRLGTRGLQAVGKKAIVDSLLKGHHGRLEESGPEYHVEIAVSQGKALVCLDSSGVGLHRRGYRTETGEAPLRETLAAGMVLLSRWDPSRPFADPLCGSGTIAIEAALVGLHMAPGFSRSFAAEQWPHVPADCWHRARDEARGAVRKDLQLHIAASDKDEAVLGIAKRNAKRAGVAGRIGFHHSALAEAKLSGEFGCIVTNPPYAERMGSHGDVAEIYRALGKMFRSLPTWSLFALSAHPQFARLFGSRPTKNRKLYNGDLRCYFYEYFGPLP